MTHTLAKSHFKEGNEPDEPVHRQALAAALSGLTRCQRLVCVWKKAGFSNVEIARHLGCAPREVEEMFDAASAALRAALRG